MLSSSWCILLSGKAKQPHNLCVAEVSRIGAVIHRHQCVSVLLTEGDSSPLRRQSRLEPL